MKRGQVNEFETYIPIEIDIDNFSLQEGTNKVFVRVYQEDVKETVGGIITEGLDHFKFAEHTERRGMVVKTVKTIQPGQNGIETMMHDTDVEIREGDEVYFNYLDNINSFIYKCKDEIYKLIPYSSIILAKRKDEVVMCNGYLLLESVTKEKPSNVYIPKEEEYREGIVKHAGSLNKMYYQVIMYNDIDKFLENNPDKNIYAYNDKYVLINHPDRTDYGTKNIKEGDHVLLGDTRWKFPLEVYAYARFDERKVYYVCPRHCIVAILN